MKDMRSISPVSYTHLDVYKRQVCVRWHLNYTLCCSPLYGMWVLYRILTNFNICLRTPYFVILSSIYSHPSTLFRLSDAAPSPCPCLPLFLVPSAVLLGILTTSILSMCPAKITLCNWQNSPSTLQFKNIFYVFLLLRYFFCISIVHLYYYISAFSRWHVNYIPLHLFMYRQWNDTIFCVFYKSLNYTIFLQRCV